MIEAVALYLLALSLAAFAAFWADKRAAGLGRHRVPESTLLLLALVGGTPGAFAGQQLLRHKTRKEPFRSLLWAIAGLQALLLAALAVQLIAR